MFKSLVLLYGFLVGPDILKLDLELGHVQLIFAYCSVVQCPGTSERIWHVFC